MTIDHQHNFYRHHCPVLEHSTFYAGCLKRIATSEPDRSPLYTPCYDAITARPCKCPAVAMRQDEENGVATYYHDRDDAGPGILKR